MVEKMSILLVDDEPLARYACRKLISEHFSEYEVIGEASTGSEALESFRVLDPDIVLMDIELPEISGLDASLIILKENADAQIIIVSAYEDFEYAKKAMNIGVLGYIVKPIQIDALRDLLRVASKNISNARQVSQEQNDLHVFRLLATKDMITAFMYGRYGGVSARSFAKLLAQPIKEGVFALCSFSLSDPMDEEKQDGCVQAVNRFPNCYVGHWIGNVLPVFVSSLLGPIDSIEKINDRIDSFAKELLRYLSMKTGLPLIVRVGGWQQDPSQFPHSFQQALDLLQDDASSPILVYQVEPVATDCKTVELIDQEDQFPEVLLQRLMEALVHGQDAQSREIIVSIGRWLCTYGDTFFDVRYIITELMILIQNNKVLRAHGHLRNTVSSLIRILNMMETKEQIIHWFPNAMERIIDSINRSTPSEESNIQRILHYIDLNDLGSSISLDSLADFIGFTPQYISKLFKQKFNINFSDYVCQRRIELACDLLKNTDLSVKDVAYKSGYNDVSYFSKVFGKITGFTPREYRLKTR